MPVSTYAFRLHYLVGTGDDLPADYIHPPSDAKGNPTLDAVLFVPVEEGRLAAEADEIHVHRIAKGERWRCVKRMFHSTDGSKRRTDITRQDILGAVGLS